MWFLSLLAVPALGATLSYPAELTIAARSVAPTHSSQIVLDVFEPGDVLEVLDGSTGVTGCTLEKTGSSTINLGSASSTYTVTGSETVGTWTLKCSGYDDVRVRIVADAHHSPSDGSSDATQGIWFQRHTPAALADFYHGIDNAPSYNDYHYGGDLTVPDPDERWVPRSGWWQILDVELPSLDPGPGVPEDCTCPAAVCGSDTPFA